MLMNSDARNKSNDETLTVDHDTLKAYYDFDYSRAKPNRFAERLSQDSLMVVLDPDVAAVFPTSESVNDTLRVVATALRNLPDVTPNKRHRQRRAEVTAMQP